MLHVRVVCTVAKCLFVCLSVCVSVTIRYCVETAKHTVDIIPPPDSPDILVLCEPMDVIKCEWIANNGGP